MKWQDFIWSKRFWAAVITVVVTISGALGWAMDEVALNEMVARIMEAVALLAGAGLFGYLAKEKRDE
jgi:hypothetical protein